MKIAILIQARSESTRLPGKIFLEINGKTILQRVFNACNEAAKTIKSVENHDVLVAVIGPYNDSALRDYCTKHEVPFFGGQEEDVLSRYMEASGHYNADLIVRITADCVMMPADIISQCVSQALQTKADYISNTIIRTFVEGWDVQIVTKHALRWFDCEQKHKREHPFVEFDENAKMRDKFVTSGYSIQHFLNAANPALIKTSIDTKEDYERLKEYICKQEQENAPTSG